MPFPTFSLEGKQAKVRNDKVKVKTKVLFPSDDNYLDKKLFNACKLLVKVCLGQAVSTLMAVKLSELRKVKTTNVLVCKKINI